MKSFFFLSVFLISACQTKSSAKNPGEINSYRLTDYSVFPTTSMTFKSKDKKKQKLKIPPEEFSQNFSTYEYSKEINNLEFSEQVKFWSWGAAILGLAGLASDTKNAETQFSAILAAGVLGSLLIPRYQAKQMENFQTKLEGSKGSTKIDSVNKTGIEVIEWDESDYE